MVDFNRILERERAARAGVFQVPRVEKVFAGVLLHKGGKVLMVHKRERDCWTLPGGKPEPGEIVIAAAAREVFEETGLIPRSLRFCCEDDAVFGGVTWHGLFFECDDYSGTLVNKEPHKFYDVRFLDIDEIRKLARPNEVRLAEGVLGYVHS